MYTCVHCQNIFKPLKTNKNKPRKFCSMTCSSEHSKKKTLTKCLNCGVDTYNSKFCNSSCAATYNNSKKPKRQKQYKICLVCGTNHRRNSKYCSDSCNPRRLKMSEEEKVRYIRSRKNESWARYMAKKKNQTPADADIKAIQEFYFNCPEGYEVDHIMPISKGGLHTLSNLQYLTISENRKKSNKIL